MNSFIIHFWDKKLFIFFAYLRSINAKINNNKDDEEDNSEDEESFIEEVHKTAEGTSLIYITTFSFALFLLKKHGFKNITSKLN